MRLWLLGLLPILLTSCVPGANGRATGAPRREYALPPTQVRVAVIDTFQAMALPIESQRGETVIESEWAYVGRGHPREQARLRVEVRGAGDHAVVLAHAQHQVEVRRGLRTEWEPRESYGRVEQEFLDRLDVRCGVIK